MLPFQLVWSCPATQVFLRLYMHIECLVGVKKKCETCCFFVCSSRRSRTRRLATLDQHKATDYVIQQFSECGIVKEDFIFGSEKMGFDWDSLRDLWDKYSVSQIPNVSKDINVDKVGAQNSHVQQENVFIPVHDKANDNIQTSSLSGEEGSSGNVKKQSTLSYGGLATTSPLIGLPEFSHLGGQAEKEFRVEVEAIGHVRHKHLVRLLGYCVEGVHRLAYLHEAIEPKVIHRDIKSSNILIDDEFNAKVSDFGLAKLLDSGESHITTRVMGTFGYVAPEYANSGLLNEKSDIYSFGVLMLEAVTGRDPVDYARPANEVNLVEWLKMMVGARRAEEVVDSSLEVKPSARALKRSLLVALRCIDPDADKRPKMSQVVRMLEADEYPFREDRRNRRSGTSSVEIEAVKDISGPSDAEKVGNSESHVPETTQG
ncbi:Serine/threonine-protein kinase, active site [Sesbania bispinosa]|nr:Serine/threonine-protein kinase, active site [Sesbania bispinosa]